MKCQSAGMSGQERILEMSLVQKKGSFIKAWGQDLQAERTAPGL